MSKIYTLSFFLLLISSCVSKTKTIIISDTAYETVNEIDSIVEPPPPPTIHFSKSLSLSECFSLICKKETPKLTDNEYVCGIYKIDNHFVIFFIDAISYKKNAEEWPSKKGSDFKDKYYQIANSEFDDQSWAKVISKVTLSLGKFSITDEFKKSNLGKVKPLTIRFDNSSTLTVNQN